MGGGSGGAGWDEKNGTYGTHGTMGRMNGNPSTGRRVGERWREKRWVEESVYVYVYEYEEEGERSFLAWLRVGLWECCSGLCVRGALGSR